MGENQNCGFSLGNISLPVGGSFALHTNTTTTKELMGWWGGTNNSIY